MYLFRLFPVAVLVECMESLREVMWLQNERPINNITLLPPLTYPHSLTYSNNNPIGLQISFSIEITARNISYLRNENK